MARHEITATITMEIEADTYDQAVETFEAALETALAVAATGTNQNVLSLPNGLGH